MFSNFFFRKSFLTKIFFYKFVFSKNFFYENFSLQICFWWQFFLSNFFWRKFFFHKNISAKICFTILSGISFVFDVCEIMYFAKFFIWNFAYFEFFCFAILVLTDFFPKIKHLRKLFSKFFSIFFSKINRISTDFFSNMKKIDKIIILEFLNYKFFSKFFDEIFFFPKIFLRRFFRNNFGNFFCIRCLRNNVFSEIFYLNIINNYFRFFLFFKTSLIVY